jgi:uncharacterized protein (DUF2141 family)
MAVLMVAVIDDARASELRVTISGVRSDAGELLIGVYGSAEGFGNAIANAATRGLVPDQTRLVGMAIRATHGAQQAVFAQLQPGRYAIIVIHDENDNGRLDENALGVPIEGYGFSNDAQGFLSAPSFDAAAITLDSTDQSVAISLRYPAVRTPNEKQGYDQFIGSSRPNR